MSGEFEIAIREALLKASLSAASEIYTSPPARGFGDCESLWKLGNLRLRFVRDRSQMFVDLGSKFDESRFFNFDGIALFMNWQKLEEMIKTFTENPPSLEYCLNFIKQDLDKLEFLFSKTELQSTSEKIDRISRAKMQTLYGQNRDPKPS